jgi:hypothetical protein
MARPKKKSGYQARCANAEEILKRGVVMEDPCAFCLLKNVPCVRDRKCKNCAVCTRRGVPCNPAFVPDSKWEDLINAESRTDAQIEALRDSARSLSVQLSNTLMQLHQIEEYRKNLKERGLAFLRQDNSALGQLESEETTASPDPEVDVPASSSSGILLCLFLAIDHSALLT